MRKILEKDPQMLGEAFLKMPWLEELEQIAPVGRSVQSIIVQQDGPGAYDILSPRHYEGLQIHCAVCRKRITKGWIAIWGADKGKAYCLDCIKTTVIDGEG